jgi:co-chaperonin GroES (HSP10)
MNGNTHTKAVRKSAKELVAERSAAKKAQVAELSTEEGRPSKVWVPMWKKVLIELDSAAENMLKQKDDTKEKSLIILPEEMLAKKEGLFSATVVGYDPLAGTDAKSGIRYHRFAVGQKVLVNKQHIQRVFYQGKSYTFINDFFIMAVLEDGQPADRDVPIVPIPLYDQFNDGEMRSTIHSIENADELDN